MMSEWTYKQRCLTDDDTKLIVKACSAQNSDISRHFLLVENIKNNNNIM